MNNDTPSTPSVDNTAGEFVPSVPKEEFIKQLDNFDPIADLPSVWEGADKLPPASPDFKIGLQTFSPEIRQQLQARGRELNPVNPEAGTERAIQEHTRRKVIEARVRSMPESATFYQKEAAALELERYRADERADQIIRDMAKQRTVVDPTTGKEIETGDPYYSPERLKALGDELATIRYRAKLLEDTEGPRRLLEAGNRDYTAYVERERAAWEAKQASRLADKMLADDRIKRQAEGIAKHRRGNLGT